MYHREHNPPHFHVRYNEYKAMIAIENLALLAGKLPPKALGLVMEWASLHQTELMENWSLAEKMASLKNINPWSNCMLYDVVQAKVLSGYTIYLRFENGREGNVDISQLLTFDGVFAPLCDLGYFSTVTVDGELGTICWDNGADISSEVLYDAISA